MKFFKTKKKEKLTLLAAVVIPGGFIALGVVQAWKLCKKIHRDMKIQEWYKNAQEVKEEDSEIDENW